MSDFTETLTKIETIENTHERVDVSNFYVSNHLRENDCCVSSEDWEMILYYDFDPWCLIDDITEHWTPELKRKVAKTWWEEFKKINTEDYGQTTESFMFFPKGTDQLDVIQTFKDFFDVDVIEDKDFMGMLGFTNGDYLINALKRNQGEKEMTREKEITIYFADGREADIYRYKSNEYCIQFNDTGLREYGSYLKILNIIKDYEAKLTDANKKDNEENHPMTSYGNCMNLWTTGGDYDVFIIFHELQTNQHEEVCEKVVHQIMNHRKTNDTKEELSKRIQDALWALVDWEENEPCVFITHMKGSDI